MPNTPTMGGPSEESTAVAGLVLAVLVEAPDALEVAELEALPAADGLALLVPPRLAELLLSWKVPTPIGTAIGGKGTTPIVVWPAPLLVVAPLVEPTNEPGEVPTLVDALGEVETPEEALGDVPALVDALGALEDVVAEAAAPLAGAAVQLLAVLGAKAVAGGGIVVVAPEVLEPVVLAPVLAGRLAEEGAELGLETEGEAPADPVAAPAQPASTSDSAAIGKTSGLIKFT